MRTTRTLGAILNMMCDCSVFVVVVKQMRTCSRKQNCSFGGINNVWGMKYLNAIVKPCGREARLYIHDQRARYDWVLWIFMQRRADHWPAVLLIILHLGGIGKNQQRSFPKWQNLLSIMRADIHRSIRPSNPPSLGPNDVDSLPELPRLQLSQLSFFLRGAPR